MQQHLHTYSRLKTSIEQLSPQAVLARGYAIVRCNDKTIINSNQLHVGQEVCIQLHVGEAQATIIKKH